MATEETVTPVVEAEELPDAEIVDDRPEVDIPENLHDTMARKYNTGGYLELDESTEGRIAYFNAHLADGAIHLDVTVMPPIVQKSFLRPAVRRFVLPINEVVEGEVSSCGS